MVVTDWQLEHVAYALFRANMDEYGFSEEMLMIEWAGDPGIQAFWRHQAKVSLEAFGVVMNQPEPV
jgi:hypothetical protein